MAIGHLYQFKMFLVVRLKPFGQPLSGELVSHKASGQTESDDKADVRKNLALGGWKTGIFCPKWETECRVQKWSQEQQQQHGSNCRSICSWYTSPRRSKPWADIASTAYALRPPGQVNHCTIASSLWVNLESELMSGPRDDGVTSAYGPWRVVVPTHGTKIHYLHSPS
jgi:hypothetical protein